MPACRLTVGNYACDIRGFTNVHIQCAVDRMAFLGGGEVEVSEGVFAMADSLHLRTNVRVTGQGERTALRKNAMKAAKVDAFLGFGHYDLVVDQPDAFSPGDGIIIRDDNARGFYTTVGTLVRREGDTWFTNRPHSHDYLERTNGIVETLFPIVSAYDAADGIVEGLTLDGNAAENPTGINGCRGGAFFAMRSHRMKARGLRAREYNGEGFSFQTCDDMEITDCVAENCRGNGFHPGSGSNRFHIHRCAARANTRCGLFYCLRVRHGVLEDCVFEGNGSHGVFIGSRDTDHINRRLTIRGNAGAGIFITRERAPNAPHRNVIENCTLEANCTSTASEACGEIVLQGSTEGLQVVGNAIRRAPGKPGILVQPEVPLFVDRDNRIEPPGADARVDLRGNGSAT